jgi:uncharacterized protein YbbC (DUF1343 family)
VRRSTLLSLAVLGAGLLAGCGAEATESSGREATSPVAPGAAPAAPQAMAAAAGRRATSATAEAARASPKPAVAVGLERLDAPEARVLAGKRVGLIANAASVTTGGRPSADVLRAKGIRVVRFFAPEHGLSGRLAAGARVDGGADVVSLYGDHVKPTRAQLRGLDALVYDLQDAGVRFYTYVSTMILAQEAAAEAGVPFVVLDRPNPLGGERVAGPVADLPKTLVNRAPGPLVHGLTAGEMARVVQRRSSPRGRLVVVAMQGWRRTMTWADTGRRWVRPSPNLRSAQAALLYPGVALIEGTTISEGRGTPAPFQFVGAPGADARRIATAAAAPGIGAQPRTFTPRPSAAEPSPKFAGRRCSGIRLDVTAGDADTWRLGLRLLRALEAQPGFAWRDGGKAFDTLVGTRRLRRAIDRGASVEAIVDSQRAGVDAWRRSRAAALLYH